MVAPLEPRDRPFGERADAVEFERIEAQPVLDQTVGGEAGLVIAVTYNPKHAIMVVKSTVQTAYLSCLINRFTFRPKPRTRTPFQLIDHVHEPRLDGQGGFYMAMREKLAM